MPREKKILFNRSISYRFKLHYVTLDIEKLITKRGLIVQLLGRSLQSPKNAFHGKFVAENTTYHWICASKNRSWTFITSPFLWTMAAIFRVMLHQTLLSLTPNLRTKNKQRYHCNTSIESNLSLHSLHYVEACNGFAGPIPTSLRPCNIASFEEMSQQ